MVFGAYLNLDQLNAIEHQVTGSIQGMHASKVIVVHQAGNLQTQGIAAGES
ncbi:hypothetical protein ACNITI_27330, partial [Escherichia coli]